MELGLEVYGRSLEGSFHEGRLAIQLPVWQDALSLGPLASRRHCQDIGPKARPSCADSDKGRRSADCSGKAGGTPALPGKTPLQLQVKAAANPTPSAAKQAKGAAALSFGRAKASKTQHPFVDSRPLNSLSQQHNSSPTRQKTSRALLKGETPRLSLTMPRNGFPKLRISQRGGGYIDEAPRIARVSR